MTASCEHCGTTNRANANFCIGCAAQLPGFVPTGPSALELLRGRQRSDAVHAARKGAGAAQGAPDAAAWLRRLVAGGLLAMAAFLGWYGYHTREAPPPVAPLAASPAVVQQPAFVQLAPFEPEATGLAGVSDAARAAAERSARAIVLLEPSTPPSAPPPASAAPATSSGAVDTVARFYGALSAGDGATAAALVTASKRAQGPLSGDAMSAFYRSLKEPLAVRSIRQLDARVVEARYTYRATRTRCEGRALVTTEPSSRSTVIRSIAANC